MGFLLELAVGDAFGRTFEFQPRAFINELGSDITKYHQRPDEIKQDPVIGIYTDDCQMSLGTAEHMLDGFPITQVSFAKKFIQSYKRDPRGGYSKRMTNLLSTSQKPIDLLARAVPTKGNGCVMRTLPLGMLSKVENVIHAAIVQSSITHGSVEGINATVAVSLTAHYFYHEIKEEYGTWMEKQMGQLVFQQVLQAYQGGELQCEAMATASICIRIALECEAMSEALKRSIAVGGDVDSIAAVALGLAALKGTKNDLPKSLYDNLETGIYGVEYIKMVNQRLFEKFPKNTAPITNVLF